jgi:plastocyanin
MRPHSLLPLTLLAAIGAAAPASAADQSVRVPDFEFSPRLVEIDPGDSVTWNFAGPAGHTSTSSSGQAERWSSGLKQTGQSFRRQFRKPGRWQYFCQPHPFMKGVVQVGTDEVATSFTRLAVRGAGGAVKVTLTLRETAKVTVAVRGPKRKRVVKRLKKGRRSVSVKGLSAGGYRVTVVAKDDFDKTTTKRASTRVG